MKHFIPPFLIVSFCLVSCREEVTEASVNPNPASEVVERVEQKLAELENELLREKNARLEMEAKQRVLLHEIKDLVEGREDLLEEGETSESKSLEKVGIPATLDPVEVAKDQLDLRGSARRDAVGETYPYLLTLSGESYYDLEILEVTDLGVVFRHRTGVARIPFSELPKSWGERFHYDPQRTAKAVRNEQLAQARRDQIIAREVAVMKEQAEQEAVDAQLALLADAVNDLRRRENDRDANRFVVGGAFANPPIFWQDQFGFWDGFFCPPVVQPRVIHPPVVRNPHQPGTIVGTGNSGGGVRVGSSVVQRQPVQRIPVSPVTRPPVQRVTPTVVRPASRAGNGSPAVSRPRTTVPPSTPTRTVRPSSSGRSGGSSPVIRRTR